MNKEQYADTYLSKTVDPKLTGHYLKYSDSLWTELIQCRAITGDNITAIVLRGTAKEVEAIKKKTKALLERGIQTIDGTYHGRSGRKIP